MAREDPQLKLRLHAELKQRLIDAAEQNNRSVNAEIVSRLEQSFGKVQPIVPTDVTDLVHAVIDRMIESGWKSPENNDEFTLEYKLPKRTR